MDRAQLVDEVCRVVSNEKVGPNLYLLVLEAARTCELLLPGQFIHAQIPDMPDHLLRRPFSVYQTDANKNTLSVLYQVVGYGTDCLTRVQDGATVNCIGPIGNGWSLPSSATKVLLVGGGVGSAPLYLFARELAKARVKTTVVLGAQTKDALVTLHAYEQLEVDVIPATDDGSFGYAGFCTDPARDVIASGVDFVACCGPEPLMRIVAGMAADNNIACQVSLERRMACGVGACLSCVVDTTDGKKRACVDGPIFPAEQVVW